VHEYLFGSQTKSYTESKILKNHVQTNSWIVQINNCFFSVFTIAYRYNQPYLSCSLISLSSQFQYPNFYRWSEETC